MILAYRPPANEMLPRAGRGAAKLGVGSGVVLAPDPEESNFYPGNIPAYKQSAPKYSFLRADNVWQHYHCLGQEFGTYSTLHLKYCIE